MDENELQKNSDSNIKTIHTYTSDMADAIRENETSVIKIALAEKEKREREEIYKQAAGTKTSKFFLFLGGTILILGAIAGSYFLYKKSSTAPTSSGPVMKDVERFISYDDKSYVDVTENKNQNDLFNSLKGDLEKGGKEGSIKEIFLTQKVNNINQLLSLDGLMSLANIGAPAPLVRTLDEEYMVGTYTKAEKPHLFLIFKIKDYNQSYAAMLEWEKTMLRDMFVLFNIDVSADSETLFEKPWRDIIINNKDARILYDKEGKEMLYYIFPNKTTFIITDNQDAIKEISLRLLAKTTKPL